MDHADTNLVIAAITPRHSHHERARRHVADRRLKTTLAVGIELLLVANKQGLSHEGVIDLAEARFEVEGLEVLRTAARLLDRHTISTVFDAVHVAEAFLAKQSLHTADKALLKSAYPTTAF